MLLGLLLQQPQSRQAYQIERLGSIGNWEPTPGVKRAMHTFWEKLEGTTDQILAEIKRMVAEGNLRRVVVKQRGRVVAEFPVTVGVIGAVIAPLAAAIGALAAVLTDCTIEVEKTVAADRPVASEEVTNVGP